MNDEANPLLAMSGGGWVSSTTGGLSCCGNREGPKKNLACRFPPVRKLFARASSQKNRSPPTASHQVLFIVLERQHEWHPFSCTRGSKARQGDGVEHAVMVMNCLAESWQSLWIFWPRRQPANGEET